jgi:phosphate:Na+ symporter
VIAAMHAELVESLRIGLTVFLRGDAALRDARRLVARKRVLRRQEAEAAGLNIHSPQNRGERVRRCRHEGRCR